MSDDKNRRPRGIPARMKLLEARLDDDEQQLRGVQGDLTDETRKIDALQTTVAGLLSRVTALETKLDRRGPKA
jgi:hypothetical protein